MDDTTAVWDRIAGFWDAQIGEGNDFQRTLVMPTTDRMLGDVAGRHVLDACCGNGNYARKLAERGAIVTAFDGSTVFIDHAKKRTPKSAAIDYRVIDATDAAQLATLENAAPDRDTSSARRGDFSRHATKPEPLPTAARPPAHSFDLAVCSMAMMDLSTITPLLNIIRRTLAPGGAFVFSVCHPCFNATGVRMTAEMRTAHGRDKQYFGVATDTYLTPRTDASEGIINQPEPHPMFHRPMSLLLRECFAAGFVCDALEEPAYPVGSPAKNAFAWAKRPEIPPVLAIRLR